MPEANKAPWLQDWGASVYQEQPQEASTALLPWQQDWGLGDVAGAVSDAVQGATKAFQSFSMSTVQNRMWQAESQGQHRDEKGNLTKSPVGALGITQIMPATGRKPGFGIEPLKDDSKEEYLRVGNQYVEALHKKYSGDWRKAVAAYNAGPGNVDKAVKQALKEGGDFTQYLPKASETIPYLDKVLGTTGGVYAS